MKLKVTSDRGEVQIHKITGREDKVEAAILFVTFPEAEVTAKAATNFPVVAVTDHCIKEVAWLFHFTGWRSCLDIDAEAIVIAVKDIVAEFHT